MHPSTTPTPNSGAAHWLLLGLLLNPAWSQASEEIEPAKPNSPKETATDLRQDASDRVPTRPSSPDRPIPKPAPQRTELKSKVDQAARQHGLDRDLAHALIRAESAYNPQAVSSAGAIGLMQVMPETAADYGVQNPDALFETETNLNTGMRHFKRLLDKYGNIGAAVMAYNAGEGALERSGGFVSYAETQRYTHQVLTSYLGSKGIDPYSARAREATGIALTPAMATAGGGKAGGGVRRNEPDTARPVTDQVWQSTVRRPEFRPEFNRVASSRSRAIQTRVSSRSPSPLALKVSSLRMTPPRYANQLSRAVAAKRR
ncbi:lytic transglycosylase domain-containing protein [Thiocystis violascens]|uniref:Soluble lytic murein transglycosylase-like protein n=1 Tax=Thiocystis violascens (strain ATCC 17096 / DSM 198 / 6111) TaxID=765911 RepID=I3YAU5_THIV6|nr:lytic transglycosylase domain-containing protein [Thiocystis violascens]AFL74113.1 soluble lytic murein transglycosylase-like protein [Thiocystis violascens DSM 198]